MQFIKNHLTPTVKRLNDDPKVAKSPQNKKTLTKVNNSNKQQNLESKFKSKMNELYLQDSDQLCAASLDIVQQNEDRKTMKAMESMKNQLTSYSQEREIMLDEIKKLKEQLNAQPTSEYAKKSLILEKSIEMLRKADLEKSEQLQAKEQNLQELQKQMQAFNESQGFINDLKNQQIEAQKNQAELKNQIQDQIRQINELQKVINEKEYQHTQFIQSQQQQDFNYQQQIQNLQSQINELNNLLSQKSCQISEDFELIKKLEYQIQDLKGKIRVCVRVRPTQRDKIQFQFPDSFNYRKQMNYQTQNQRGVDGRDANKEVQTEFDRVFNTKENQNDIFDEFSPLVGQIFDGYKTLIFAYGQSGSGKTYTQYGNPEAPGVMPRALEYIFNKVEAIQNQVEIWVQFFEIYNDKVFDLLADQTCENLKQSAVERKPFEAPSCKVQIIGETVKLQGLNQVRIHNIEEAMDLVDVSQQRRKTSATVLNDTSSRSHAIFQIHVEQIIKGQTLKGSLTIVDLAGSEQIQNANVDEKRKEESIFINKSLSCLSNVFINIKSGGHVNYRDSTLTKVLQEYFQGNNKVVMVVCLNEDAGCYQETLNSMNFAQRVRGVSINRK
ncbi:Kinesin-like_protein [Hexamita inflata]|uniref:Kinesin-like protein n=1 Tax=Hexamita inflata TaxID=28002 RepID=A0AA86PJT4_9EUKA|nr:Kinesin-like protein [Hexamita inflata]